MIRGVCSVGALVGVGPARSPAPDLAAAFEAESELTVARGEAAVDGVRRRTEPQSEATKHG